VLDAAYMLNVLIELGFKSEGTYLNSAEGQKKYGPSNCICYNCLQKNTLIQVLQMTMMI
jgi:polynucleotide 5'-kinase involved in rRNA processing